MELLKYQTAIDKFFSDLTAKQGKVGSMGPVYFGKSFTSELSSALEREKHRQLRFLVSPESYGADNESRTLSKQLDSLLKSIWEQQLKLLPADQTPPFSQELLKNSLGESAYQELTLVKILLVDFSLHLNLVNFYQPNRSARDLNDQYNRYFHEFSPIQGTNFLKGPNFRQEVQTILASKDLKRADVQMDKAKDFILDNPDLHLTNEADRYNDALEQIRVLENLKCALHFEKEVELDDLWGNMDDLFETITQTLEPDAQEESEDLDSIPFWDALIKRLEAITRTSRNIDDSLYPLSLPRKILEWAESERSLEINFLQVKAGELKVQMEAVIPTDLTVPELAYLFRSLADAGLIIPKKITTMSKVVTSLFSSRRETSPSWHNFKNHYDSPDPAALNSWEKYFRALRKNTQEKIQNF